MYSIEIHGMSIHYINFVAFFTFKDPCIPSPELFGSPGAGSVARHGGWSPVPAQKQPRLPLQLHHMGPHCLGELIYKNKINKIKR